MAQAEAEFYNEAGALVLSSLAKSLVFLKKGTHTTSTDQSSSSSLGTRSTLTLTGITQAALVAFRPRSSNVTATVYFASSLSGGKREFYIACSRRDEELIDWWVYDLPTAVNRPSNLKFDIYDTAGNLTWRLYADYLRIIDYYFSATWYFGDDSNQRTRVTAVPDGKVYAFVSGGFSGAISDQKFAQGSGGPVAGPPDGGGGQFAYVTQTYANGFYQSDNEVGVHIATIGRATLSHSQYRDPQYFMPSQGLIVDVTGL